MIEEQKFWIWFKQNEAKYFSLDKIENENEKEILLDVLLDRLHTYCDNLFFEIGGRTGEKQDLIITAQGNTDYFNKIESLVEHAPELENWNIIAFKPPTHEDCIINMNGISLDPKTMWFMPLNNPASKKIGLRVHIENYEEALADDLLNATYLLLDNILGEKSSALNIGYVDIKGSPSIQQKEELIEFNRVNRYVKWKQTIS